MKRAIAYVLFAGALLSGCLRLDANLFNANQDIDAYLLDDYDGEVDFILSEDYRIPDSLISLFTLNSRTDESDAEIYAIYIGDIAKISSDTVIMYCHGNKDHMDFYWQRAKLLANVGGKNRFGVLMIDYRGYGLSEGSSSEDGLYADVDAGVEWLKSNGLTADRLVYYGFSLGSAPAVELSVNARAMGAAKLILESPFASSEVMVQDASQLALPGSYFTSAAINNADKIRSWSKPFLWMHGTEDDFLAMDSHGEVVYKNYSGEHGLASRVNGAGHGNLPVVAGFAEYSALLERFIADQ